ncbi:MAG: Dabb family protein [Calditrichaceae bacterium]
MVKHIVLWRFKTEGDTDNKLRKMQKLKIMIEALRENIDGILELEVGIDINNSESSADMVLYSVFESRQAYDFYQAHPEHQKVASKLKEITLERRVADYEI